MPDYIDAHKFCNGHKQQLLKDTSCGCFYCLTIFSPCEIIEWIDFENKDTALCPYCGIDSIIGEHSKYPITKEFLGKMRKYWF